MERIGIQLHSRPMAGAALGAVMASVLALLVPDWLLLALCAALIPVSVFLFKRRSAFFLLPAVLFFVLVRAVLLPAQMPPIRFVTTLREQLCLNADALFSDRAAEARGILLGDRSMMDSALTAQYAQSGLLHMFAVSGLHVTLLVGAFSRIVRSSVRWLTLAAEALFCVFLCAVTGFSASVLRAVFMLLGVQLCRLRDRQVDRASVLCFAMACTLLLDPYSVSTAGFQMSFAAAGGMVLLAKAFRKPFKRFGNSAIVRALTSAAAASLGLLPLQAYYFGSVAWVSIPLSILLIPTMPIILVCGFFAVFLYGFAPHIANVLSLPAYGTMEFL
ncbi:MAG: ComEC/Rec2 family competence protein, partial [Clostridia bacterium]|nr:ComEC/Rec2 family competence protein [Clostridia bacterium]